MSPQRWSNFSWTLPDGDVGADNSVYRDAIMRIVLTPLIWSAFLVLSIYLGIRDKTKFDIFQSRLATALLLLATLMYTSQTPTIRATVNPYSLNQAKSPFSPTLCPRRLLYVASKQKHHFAYC